ncbi:MAG TPA: lipopolysaccharide biosynthesis protein [Pyrinomonadaceae bacterium]|nr:lipopolysaccharide biosynthesis protein [Pyrinomonadaceae bacterium]
MNPSQAIKTELVPKGTDKFFRTDHLKADLAGRTARSGVVMIAAQGSKFVITMISAVVLARLLTPQDYGLIAMVAVFTNFTYLFRNLGLSAATMQRAEINHEQISTLFWVNVALSLVTMLVTAACAPLIAAFYHEPRLTWVTLGIVVGFIFGGLTVQHEALLKRQMRFAAIGTIDVVSMLVGLLVSVTLAWYGAGYWALVGGQLAIGASYAAGVWIVCDWRPSLPSKNSGVRSMLAFGSNLTGYNFLNYFSRNTDNLLIGRLWGSQQLGLYSRAYQLLLLPLDQVCSPLDGVAVTALSKLTDTPERYSRAYLRILEKLAMVTMPGVALMVATSDWLVHVMLGPKWVETGRIFAVLGVVGMLEPISLSIGWLLISQGRTRRILQWGIIDSALSLLSIGAGLPWGAFGVAVSYSLAGFFLRKPLLFWFACRTGPVRVSDFYRAILPSLCAAICVLAAVFGFRWWASGTKPLAGLLISLAVGACAAFLVFFILPSGRRALKDVKSIIALLLKGRAAEGAVQ